MLSASDVSIVVVFDNNSFRRDLKASWGFACVVRGADKTILFDTGGDGAILMDNMKKLKIDPKTVDAVVISHEHRDHARGLGAFLAQNAAAEVYLIRSSAKELKDKARSSAAKVFEVGDPQAICDDVWSTGEAGSDIVEQSLALRTDRGLMLITGCAHPGIVFLAEKARRILGKHDVSIALGGFHLRGERERELQRIIRRLKELGVSRVGPGHCSGNRCRELFRKEFGENFVRIGTGTSIRGDI